MLKKYFPYIMIALGCLIIGIALFQRVSTIYYQNKYIEDYYNSVNESRIDEEKEKHTIDNTEDYAASSEELPPTLINPDDEKGNKDSEESSKEQEIVAVLEIEKININVAILEGTGNNALRYTVGHYPNTAGPGENGNFVLLGHRNYRYGHFFKRLNELEIGDKIVVKKDLDTYTYKVTQSFIVSPEDTWVLNPTSDAQITMITCTPIGTYTHRLIVKGVLENENN